MRVDIYFPHLIPLDTDLFLGVFSQLSDKKARIPKKEKERRNLSLTWETKQILPSPSGSLYISHSHTPDRAIFALWRILETVQEGNQSQYISIAPFYTLFYAKHSGFFMIVFGWVWIDLVMGFFGTMDGWMDGLVIMRILGFRVG